MNEFYGHGRIRMPALLSGLESRWFAAIQGIQSPPAQCRKQQFDLFDPVGKPGRVNIYFSNQSRTAF